MLKVVTCTCGGAERTARDVLMKGGLQNYMEFPITKGKNPSLREVDAIPDQYKDMAEYKALVSYIKKSGRFVIIFGYKDDTFRWADVSRGSIKEKIDGEIIVTEMK